MRGLTSDEYSTLMDYARSPELDPDGRRWSRAKGPITRALLKRGLVTEHIYQAPDDGRWCAITNVTALGKLAMSCHVAAQSLGTVCSI